jgi:hypothetical protein
MAAPGVASKKTTIAFRMLIACGALVVSACSFPVVPDTPDDATPAAATDCNEFLRDARASVAEAELYPPTSAQNALSRIRNVNNLAPGFYGESLLESLGAGSVETVGHACGSADEMRIAIYLNWAQVLRDEANDYFLPALPVCQNWTGAAIRFDILNDAAAFSPFVVHFGLHDPDIRHVDLLLHQWARRERISLPSLRDTVRIESLASSYAQGYLRADGAFPRVC